MAGACRIGCAGWSIPREFRDRFPAGKSRLASYAQVLPAVEINSSFYRYHKPETYERWAEETPSGFRFSVKAPKEITHELRLAKARAPLLRFLEGVTRLGRKLGPLLVQLPPSLDFDRRRAGSFFRLLRDHHPGPVVCEPRHPSWFDPEADRLLEKFRVARVAADPAPASGASDPGGWKGLAYHRLHGSPRMYYSAYSVEFLDSLAARLRGLPRSVAAWCIFDNTAADAALPDAFSLLERLSNYMVNISGLEDVK